MSKPPWDALDRAFLYDLRHRGRDGTSRTRPQFDYSHDWCVWGIAGILEHIYRFTQKPQSGVFPV